MSPRRRYGGDICAIYVHAGAGFHSYQNEKIHLEACNDATKIGMALLKNGGSALDAVEIALRLMEDREITNAGYGSNLTADGTVECDATIVDHMGRSGAVGACSNIKNPISAARMLLDCQDKPLSLQRVPPNFLVGQGATDFAYDHGMSVVTHDFLVSHTAKSRWLRWQHDLETDRKQEAENAAGEENDHRSGSSSSSASFTSTLNYAVPATPSSTAHCNIQPKDKGSLPADSTTLGSDTTFVDADGPSSVYSPERSQVAGMIQKQLTISTNSPGQDEDDGTSGDQALLSSDGAVLQTSSEPQFTHSTKLAAQVNTNSMSIADMQAAAQVPGLEDMCSGAPKSYSFSQDSITDTIGAIAIDCFGNIAAGSSSGGIGMKHRGRVGPAALVGIGTAVVPVDPKDPDETSVAVVTSGTGEHIATTMAASVCANRVYFSDRKDEIGMTENVTEDEAIKSMVDLDFMEHPGVKNSHCEAAIGVMAVKKTKEGIYLYFCHNTESFALASMSSEDKKPLCVMSRRARQGTTAQGGRLSRYHRYRSRSRDDSD